MTPADPGHDLPRRTDEELVQAVARIEPAPFEVLYQRHGAAAYSLARYMLGSHGHAEDVVQEAFMNLWRGAARYDPARGSVRSWLLGMVRNRSIDMLRSLTAHERRRISIVGLEDRIAADEEIERECIRRAEANRVRSALGTLPPDQRQVLWLTYFGGWTQTEIAKHFDMPLGTVKGRARLGLEKLRWSLHESAHAEG